MHFRLSRGGYVTKIRLKKVIQNLPDFHVAGNVKVCVAFPCKFKVHNEVTSAHNYPDGRWWGGVSAALLPFGGTFLPLRKLSL